jgi:hypothetical protein
VPVVVAVQSATAEGSVGAVMVYGNGCQLGANGLARNRGSVRAIEGSLVLPVPSGSTVNHPCSSMARRRLPSGDHVGSVNEVVTRRWSLPSAAATQITACEALGLPRVKTT